VIPGEFAESSRAQAEGDRDDEERLESLVRVGPWPPCYTPGPGGFQGRLVGDVWASRHPLALGRLGSC
jgi:hypothetical protein